MHLPLALNPYEVSFKKEDILDIPLFNTDPITKTPIDEIDPVSLTPFKDVAKVAQLPCHQKHYFEESVVEKLVQKICPLCRTSFTPKTVKIYESIDRIKNNFNVSAGSASPPLGKKRFLRVAKTSFRLKPTLQKIAATLPFKLIAIPLNCVHWGFYFAAKSLLFSIKKISQVANGIFLALPLCFAVAAGLALSPFLAIYVDLKFNVQTGNLSWNQERLRKATDCLLSFGAYVSVIGSTIVCFTALTVLARLFIKGVEPFPLVIGVSSPFLINQLGSLADRVVIPKPYYTPRSIWIIKDYTSDQASGQ